MFSSIINCINLANNYRLESISFPAISTGVFHFPAELCAEIFFKAITFYSKNFKKSDNLTHIRFVLFDDKLLNIFKNE